MHLRFLSYSLLLWTLASPGPFAAAQLVASASQESAPATYDIRAFAAELQRLSAALQANPSPAELASLRDALPKQWSVTTPERTYSISTQPLREKLASPPLAGAREWLDHLAREVRSYSDLRIADSQTARSELTRILAQSEFGAVRPPNAWDLFRQRILAWLERRIGELLERMARYPIGGKILFWLLVFGGVSFIALLVIRFLTSRDRVNMLPASEILAPVRTWQEWVRLAREAAHRGDYREAVHAAYWAGIVRLQDTGVLPRDRAKTPREYLHVISDPAAHDLAPKPDLREALAGLTARFERTWYANRGTRPEDFSDSFQELKELGCPLE